MKTLLTILLTLSSLSTLAYEEITSPLVQFSGTRVPMTHVCLNNDGDLQTTFAVQQYKVSNRPSGDRGPIMIPTFKKILTTSIIGTKSVCVKESRGSRNDWCAKWESRPYTYPLSFTAKYYEVKHGSERTTRKLVKTEVLDIQNCL